MRALILCAGKGTRLKPITDQVPKPMVTVSGRPVLEHLVFHLHKHGIKQIMVNLHHMPFEIMEYFGSSLVYSYETELLGEERTIASLSHWLEDRYTVVMNGDTLTNIDITRLYRLSGGRNIRSMEGKTYTGTMILSPDYFTGDRRFIDYHDAELWWQDMGTAKGLAKARKHYEKLSNLSKLSN
jgi:NDP-sugar pyrophosphorylase family protein